MAKVASKKLRRQGQILDVLTLNPTMRVNELARTLAVSSETVRRDLAELDETGQIQRTYGGAVRTKEFEPALADRLKLHIQERERIARFALSQIEGMPSIFIGGGATTLHFARALRHIKHKITVLTASYSVAVELATNPLIEVMVLPGTLDPEEGQVYGPETVDFIARYNVPVAIMGASAIDENGVSEASLSAAQTYSAMIEHANRTMILADSSKFGTRSLQAILDWGPTTSLITDTTPRDELKNMLDNHGVELLIADGKGASEN